MMAHEMESPGAADAGPGLNLLEAWRRKQVMDTYTVSLKTSSRQASGAATRCNPWPVKLRARGS